MDADPLPQHALDLAFPVVDDCLTVGGVAVTRLAERVGRTPFYAYDRAAMSGRVQTLRRRLPEGVRLHYAMKANPMPAVVAHLVALVDGIDVASAGEMQVALDAGAAPGHVSFAGPGKADHELAQAIAAGITVNLESEREMERAARLGERLGVVPRVAVRVNPDFELKTSGMRMSGGPKPFGVDAERVPAMLERLGALGLQFRGLHIFSGSQNLRPEAIREAQTKTVDLALALSAHAPAPPPLVNIGGGFGIPYFPGDHPLDLTEVADNLASLAARVSDELPGTELALELGRYLVGEAGVYVCRIVDRKESRGELFLVTDGGLHHHLAASGNFGQVIRKNYPVLIGNRVRGAARETATVVGPLCTPLDVLAKGMELSRADVGDLVVVLQSGAYGYTASPHHFLSHPPPAQILV